ncbi:Ku protein [Rhodopila sp.]|uniref:non-homologous end joining protein Ku n=1 Tax=Rhodopila sp. TaxID=2480087 RepID=UPI002B8868A3|nr:Ku protein [Rhodopila sp.]HVZ10094.1 Ku protein [Rhodopila sp.]
MAARASWKGFLKLVDLRCPVALYAAVSSADTITFRTLNRATGHRVQRRFVDEETGEPVDAADQVKGYQTGPDEFITLEPSEIAAAVPDSDKTLTVEAFIPCAEVDDVYLDRPYYLTPSDPVGREAYGLIRDGMRKSNVVALARTVLFRRVRTVLIRAHDAGLIATTLQFDYEVRSAREAFADIPDIPVQGEMLDLARHIIETKRGRFDAAAVHDRYEAALAELVKAKQQGKPLPRRAPARPGKVIDLMAALRQSAAASGTTSGTAGGAADRGDDHAAAGTEAAGAKRRAKTAAKAGHAATSTGKAGIGKAGIGKAGIGKAASRPAPKPAARKPAASASAAPRKRKAG